MNWLRLALIAALAAPLPALAQSTPMMDMDALATRASRPASADQQLLGPEA